MRLVWQQLQYGDITPAEFLTKGANLIGPVQQRLRGIPDGQLQVEEDLEDTPDNDVRGKSIEKNIIKGIIHYRSPKPQPKYLLTCYWRVFWEL